MKVLKFLAAGMLACVMLASCGGKTATGIEGITKAEVDSVSYAIGVSFGQMIVGSQLEGMNNQQIMKGIKDVTSGNGTSIDPQMAAQVINTYMSKVQMAISKQKQAAQAEFMAANKEKEGVQETESGLQYKIENPGNDVKATPSDTVEVHYKGTLLDGSVFDSSYDRGETAKFPLDRVITGWTEGLQLVGEGGKLTLWIPYELGYGSRQMSEEIPAYSTLVFDVELIKVYPKIEKK